MRMEIGSGFFAMEKKEISKVEGEEVEENLKESFKYTQFLSNTLTMYSFYQS